MIESADISQSARHLPSRLIQLVPRFRPDADGVGECALILGNALLKDYGLPSTFLAYKPPHPQSILEMPNPFPHTLESLAEGEAAALNRVLDKVIESSSEPPVLLLHYVSYGFSRNGTPGWLAGSMERFVKRGGRFLCFFHELYATGKFPSKVFFTSRLQRRIFLRLLEQSEASFTSNEEYRERIAMESKTPRSVGLVGICSNVGEPENPKPLVSRRRRVAVFGQYFTRKHLYSSYLHVLLKVLDHLELDEIADIGPVDEPEWMEKNVYRQLGSRVQSFGTQTNEAISRLLEDCVLGAVPYRYAMRWKSGIFAAYQAHALPILLFPHYRDEVEPEPREPGDWCFSADQLLALAPGSPAELQSAATRGFDHYQKFRSSRQMAKTILPALLQKS